MARRPLSHSQIRTFTECKWRYRETVLRKVPVLRAPALDFGALEHEAIQAYLLHLIQTRQDFAPQDVPQVWDRFTRGYVSGIAEDRWVEARRLLERFAREFRLEVDTVWEAEPRMAVNWEGDPVEWWDPRVWVRGRPDLVQVQGSVADAHDWKCLMPEQELSRAEGDRVRADAVVVGDRLLAWADGLLVTDEVLAVSEGGLQPCVEVITSHGRRLRVSANHPVLAAGRWVEAGRLRAGDWLTVGLPAPTAREVSAEEARLLGYLVAEGALTQGQCRFQSATPELVDDVKRCAKALGFEWRDEHASKSGDPIVRFFGVNHWVRRHGLFDASSRRKRVPPTIMRSAPVLVAEFLKAYFAGDGHVRRFARKVDIESVTVSEGLAGDLQELWWRLGVRATIWCQKNKTYAGVEYPVWWVKTTNRRSVRAMWEWIRDLPHPEKARRFADAYALACRPFRVSSRGREWAEPAERPEMVAAVQALGIHRTVAIEMARYGTFVTGGIASHNTQWAPMASIEDNFQAQTYAWLLHLWNRKLDVIRVHFRFVRFGLVRSATFYEPDFKETAARWRQLSDQVEAAVAEIENEKVWAPTPGPHCVGCPVVLRCPLGIPALSDALGLPTDPEQAHRLAERLLVLDAAREMLRDGLRAWVTTSGRVTVNGEAFDFYPSARWEYDIWEVVRLAKQHFVDPYLVLTVSAEKLKALLKKERPFVQAVEAKARRDAGTPAFTHRKVKDEPPDA